MALDRQQHLHVSCHCVVKEGVGVLLGQLHGLLQKEVICKAVITVTAEFPYLLYGNGMLEANTISISILRP